MKVLEQVDSGDGSMLNTYELVEVKSEACEIEEAVIASITTPQESLVSADEPTTDGQIQAAPLEEVQTEGTVYTFVPESEYQDTIAHNVIYPSAEVVEGNDAGVVLYDSSEYTTHTMLVPATLPSQ